MLINQDTVIIETIYIGEHETLRIENNSVIDINDLQTVIQHRGKALMSVGEYQGENAAYKAIKAAMASPLLENTSINGAMGVLAHFEMHPDFQMMELSKAIAIIEENTDENADVIYGTSIDASLPRDYIRITFIATGINDIDTKE